MLTIRLINYLDSMDSTNAHVLAIFLVVLGFFLWPLYIAFLAIDLLYTLGYGLLTPFRSNEATRQRRHVQLTRQQAIWNARARYEEDCRTARLLPDPDSREAAIHYAGTLLSERLAQIMRE